MNAEDAGSDGREPGRPEADQPGSDQPEFEAKGGAPAEEGPTAIELAELLGERLGYSLGRLYRAVQNLGETRGTEVEPPVEAATQQAEHLVTKAERQIEAYAAHAYHTIRRVAARAREEYEDIVAEQRTRYPDRQVPSEPPTRYDEEHQRKTGPG